MIRPQLKKFELHNYAVHNVEKWDHEVVSSSEEHYDLYFRVYG